MTNFERIKSMTIEEMAEAMVESCEECEYCGEKCVTCTCSITHLEWLNQEAE